MHDYKKELDTAKKAARKAGHILLSNKSNLNKILSTTKKDIKLQADVSAEAVIKDIIKSESTLPILAVRDLDPRYNSRRKSHRYDEDAVQ